MNPASLANLRAGNVRNRAAELAGERAMLKAVEDAIKAEPVTDAHIRWALGKVDDFEVTPAVRAAWFKERAARFYRVVINRIVSKVSEREAVSLRGLGRFEVVDPDTSIEVGMSIPDGGLSLLADSEERIRETRTAYVLPGSWSWPFQVGPVFSGGAFPADATVAGWGLDGLQVSSGAIVRIRAADVGVFNAYAVRGEGADGVIRERWVNSWYWSFTLAVRCSWGPVVNGEKELIFTMLQDQRAGLPVGQVCVDDWEAISARRLEDWPMQQAAREQLTGLSAAEAVRAYPREVTIVRRDGGVVDVKRIQADEFRAAFGWREDELRAAGKWPIPDVLPVPRIRFTADRALVTTITPNQV